MRRRGSPISLQRALGWIFEGRVSVSAVCGKSNSSRAQPRELSRPCFKFWTSLLAAAVVFTVGAKYSPHFMADVAVARFIQEITPAPSGWAQWIFPHWPSDVILICEANSVKPFLILFEYFPELLRKVLQVERLLDEPVAPTVQYFLCLSV